MTTFSFPSSLEELIAYGLAYVPTQGDGLHRFLHHCDPSGTLRLNQHIETEICNWLIYNCDWLPMVIEYNHRASIHINGMELVWYVNEDVAAQLRAKMGNK